MWAVFVCGVCVNMCVCVYAHACLRVHVQTTVLIDLAMRQHSLHFHSTHKHIRTLLLRDSQADRGRAPLRGGGVP